MDTEKVLGSLILCLEEGEQVPEGLTCLLVFRGNLILGTLQPEGPQGWRSSEHQCSQSVPPGAPSYTASLASQKARRTLDLWKPVSSLFVQNKTRSASLYPWKLKSQEQTAGLTSSSTDPLVKSTSKVATLHQPLYWPLECESQPAGKQTEMPPAVFQGHFVAIVTQWF